MAVVQMMLPIQFVELEAGIEAKAQLANDPVSCRLERNQLSMHAIMRGDKHPNKKPAIDCD